MARMFGTDGIRGVANVDLTGELAFRVGKFGAHVLTKNKKNAKILVAKDPRISSYMLESAITSGICSAGCDVYLLGVLPTPALPLLIKHYKADAAVMISASHNSMEYNGIKFFAGDGYKLSDEIEDEIEDYLTGRKPDIIDIVGDKLGRRFHHFESAQYYSQRIKSHFSEDFTLENMKIAMDCANGASFAVAPSTLRELDAELITINNYPNGININKDCGSTHIDKVQALVTQVGADIGLAFDGDADRLLAVDENGEIVDGDKIMCILAIDMKERGVLKNNTVVATVMSNMGLYKAMEEHGIHVEKTAVGDRYVLEKMIESGYNIGGEQSGHIILKDYNTTGDGLLSAVSLLEVMYRKKKKLSELASVMKTYPQVLKNVKVSAEFKQNYTHDADLQRAIADCEERLKDRGRLLLRPSGTEPLIRVMLEGDDIEMITEECDILVNLLIKKSSR